MDTESIKYVVLVRNKKGSGTHALLDDEARVRSWTDRDEAEAVARDAGGQVMAMGEDEKCPTD
jgi:hypothetical protein